LAAGVFRQEPPMTARFAFRAFDVLVVALIFTALT
jgi:hypothetical protein